MMEAVAVAIPLLLLGGAVFLGVLALLKARGVAVSDRLASYVACSTPFLAFIGTMVLLGNLEGERLVVAGHTWISAGSLSVGFDLAVDNLTLVMLSVVTGIGALIHVYSTGYMKGDPAYCRYFCYLNLFMFFMLLLVLAENLLILFIGWEGVGLSSYLLIGFWWRDGDKARAGMKAFLVNRVGDAGFLLGMILIHQTAGTLSLGQLREFVAADPAAFTAGSGFFGLSLATASCLLLFLGAAGKSAQLPLHVWLPDAMAGPTPVSALIHAATMVTAGVYMLGRINHLLFLSPTAMIVVSSIGGITAIFAATIAITQNDIKKVLAYSTVSQLGYMFVAVGIGAVSTAMFHVVAHAFFKACLFLGAGSVIHGMGGEQDMRKMGGLRRRMPYTFLTMLVAAMAMSGIPPLSGFFSKDEILWKAFSNGYGHGSFLWCCGILAAACTAFYMGRMILMTFTGSCRADEETRAHVHESPRSMTLVLVVLATGAALVGFLNVPHFFGGDSEFSSFVDHAVALESLVETHIPHELAVEFALAVFSVMIAVAGIFVAYRCYMKDPEIPGRFTARHQEVYRLVSEKYRVDEMYSRTIVEPLEQLAENTCHRQLDRNVIDGTLDRLAGSVRWLGGHIAAGQVGQVRIYVAVMIGGLLLFMLSLLS